MKNKRFIAIVLFAALCLSVFSGCGQTDSNISGISETTPTQTETAKPKETMPTDNLPEDLDYAGEKLAILARGNDDSYQEIDAESNGEVVNDAIYNRNLYIEERFNVNLEPIRGEGWQNYGADLTKIRASVNSGDNAYQLIAGFGQSIAPLALENFFHDLNAFPYIEQSQPWWYHSTVETMNICGSLYFITGDVGIMTSLGGAYVLFENDKIAEDYGIGNIADLVRDGSWTIDTMLSYTTLVYNDLDGNGIMDDQDQYGISLDHAIYSDYFAIGAGIFQIAFDDSHIPSYTPAIEKMTSLLDKIAPIFNGNDSLVGAHLLNNGNGGGRHYQMFPEGKLLFTSTELMMSTDESFRNMEDSYTILPYPKLDETQKEYYVNASHAASLWCIPVDVVNPDMSAAVLEAMGCYGYNYVTPAYFEVCLQSKISRNQDTLEMLEIIRDGAWVGAEYLFLQMFGETCHSAWHILANGGGNAASWYASKEKSINATLEKTIETFQNLNS